MEGETIEHVRLNSDRISGAGDVDRVQTLLSDIPGVRDVQVNPDDHTVEVGFDPRELSVTSLTQALNDGGYRVSAESVASPRDLSTGQQG